MEYSLSTKHKPFRETTRNIPCKILFYKVAFLEACVFYYIITQVTYVFCF